MSFMSTCSDVRVVLSGLHYTFYAIIIRPHNQILILKDNWRVDHILQV